MKIIRPLTINNAALVSSNVTEADFAVWSGVTTYAVADKVILISPTSTLTMTIASPCVVSWSANGLSNDTPVVLTTTGNLPTGLTAGQEYFVRNRTTNTFNLATVKGGLAIGTSGTQAGTHTGTARVHKIFESLVASNLNNPPLISPTKWLDSGATNRWKMFDASVQAQTSNPSSIADTFAITGRVDSAILFNVDAATARVVMTDAVVGVVYDQTFDLISASGIVDWYAYFFEPIVRAHDVVVTDMLPYADPSIAVTLTDTGNTVLCGECVLGLSKEIGGTSYGASVGIQDYSIKQKDTFGNYAILERAFNKRGRFTLFLPNTFLDDLQLRLASYRATAVVYIGADQYTSTAIYGFYKDFDVTIAYPNDSLCTLELEGLT